VFQQQRKVPSRLFELSFYVMVKTQKNISSSLTSNLSSLYGIYDVSHSTFSMTVTYYCNHYVFYTVDFSISFREYKTPEKTR